MKATLHGARNDSRAETSASWKTKTLCHTLGIESAKVLTFRARGEQVDGAIGTGHAEMPAECIARGLARIARKGVRTAHTREIAGVSFVLSREIPAGTFALRTADRITAYQMETAVPIIAVLCSPAGSELSAGRQISLV